MRRYYVERNPVTRSRAAACGLISWRNEKGGLGAARNDRQWITYGAAVMLMPAGLEKSARCKRKHQDLNDGDNDISGIFFPDQDRQDHQVTEYRQA